MTGAGATTAGAVGWTSVRQPARARTATASPLNRFRSKCTTRGYSTLHFADTKEVLAISSRKRRAVSGLRAG